MTLSSRRKFLHGSLLTSMASIVTINSVDGQEIGVTELTHLRVKVQRVIRGSHRTLPVSHFWCRIEDRVGYVPYALKTDNNGCCYFQLTLVRGIDQPTLVVGDQRRSLSARAIPPWGFFIFTI
jgi:hypothetical protein